MSRTFVNKSGSWISEIAKWKDVRGDDEKRFSVKGSLSFAAVYFYFWWISRRFFHKERNNKWISLFAGRKSLSDNITGFRIT